ncbi:NACHT domain-containing protein [Allokutzneria multivorans]|uniref:NACHT domain-containing protein n=1 Tax=Allokutzneria multivorans TaxID=1142134 RepID=A0ABP7QXL2_9PSEU
MSTIESAILKIGATVARAAGTSWLGKRRGEAERHLSLTELAGARGLGLIPQRRLGRQFEQLAETIAERLEPLVAVEVRGLTDNERLAALSGVARALEMSDLSDERVLGANLSSASVEKLVEPASNTVSAELQLTDEGVYFFRIVLREAVAYLTEVISTLPSFQNRALRALLDRDTEIIDRLRDILDRMPTRGHVSSISSANEFELEYRREVARKLDEVELFGVTLSGPSRRYPLSVAYIGLSVSMELEIAEDISVDDALSGSPRTLIRGEAGSGKTTLLRWLAVKCAQGTLESSLASWNALVPFFVELRRFVGKELPTPGELLGTIAWQIKEHMPVGWAYKVLTSGRGLILVDGIDEIAASERPKVREWLADLVGAFPRSRYVVTSRPPAVDNRWLETEGFTAAELVPMTLTRTRSFIKHWHEAVATDRPFDDEDDLSSYEWSLLASIDTNPALRKIVTNPLLCALICALNHDRRTQLPLGRMELYRTALEMLLSRRDAERRVPDAWEMPLSFSDKLVVLADLAFWLTLNQMVDADVPRVIERINSCLLSMPSKNLKAKDVYASLLLRSGLLREHSVGKVDFIHKTFQEYLAAKRVVETDSIEMLVKQAENDHYREVIVLAAGHARQREKEHLLAGILDAAQKRRVSRARRAKLQLLAIACLETAEQINPALHSQITDCLSQLIPPKSSTDARTLAVMGEDVLPLLQVPDDASPEVIVATAQTAGLVGGPQAVSVLAALAKDGRAPVLREIVRIWSFFDPVEYARDVVVQAPLPGGRLRITDAGVLPGIAHLPHLTQLTCDFDGSVKPAEFEVLQPTAVLRSLTLANNSHVRGLQWLHDHENVSELHLRDCPNLTDVRGLAELPNLVALSLLSCKAIVNRDAVLECERLQSFTSDDYSSGEIADLLRGPADIKKLGLRRCAKLVTLADLGASTSLHRLALDACSGLAGFPDLDAFPALRELSFTDCPQLHVLGSRDAELMLRSLTLRWCPGIHSLDRVGAMRELRVLNLQGYNFGDLSPLAKLDNLRSLSLADCERIEDLTPLARLPLRTLSLQRASQLIDLQPLAGMRNLTVVHSGNVHNAHLLGPGSRAVIGQAKRLED